jgi:2'-5' RNA ligase
MPSIRSFIALPTSDHLRSRIASIQSELQQLNADVKWEPPEKLHLTLKFLGNVQHQVLDTLTSALERRCRAFSRFELTYDAIGAFPSTAHPRVIWVGASLNEQLSLVQQQVEEVCTDFGIAREDRTFHPHITLGRVKGLRNTHRLTEKLKSLTFVPTQSSCTELLVMRSELRPSGSVYSVLKSIPLQP